MYTAQKDQLAYQRKRALENRNLVARLKNKPCADCQGWFAPYQMDFDHKPGEDKLECVAILVSHGAVARKRIYAEIAKCDVVCSNCHRERTHKRRILKVIPEEL
jgi:hypothetical protein